MRLKSVMLRLLLLGGCHAGCGQGTVYVPQVDAEVVVDSAVPDAAILMDAAFGVDADAEVVVEPDAGPPACQYFDHTGFSFTSTAAEFSQSIPLDLQLDGDVFSGPTYAGEDLIARTGAPIMLFFGRDTPIDCHVPPAGVTPASECCWGAPEGWTYQNLRYWTCL